MTRSLQAIQVLYFEGRDGGDGQMTAALNTQLERLRGLPGFVGAELQSSPGQPGLLLISSRWGGPAPEVAAPAGVRSWVFEVDRVVEPVSG